ncbi:hypothetical protein VNI00_009678 [Paramarasmius palmivorus]|uniref:Uncharacterized protein n=1 Tax=Paramarasmius palmivorus TaxID=297713 RepID=A0AAW0CQH7_9AGAR
MRATAHVLYDQASQALLNIKNEWLSSKHPRLLFFTLLTSLMPTDPPATVSRESDTAAQPDSSLEEQSVGNLVAVGLFKAGLKLAVKRQANDDKVRTLNLTMCDMMEMLKLLKKIDPQELGNDGLTIEARLHKRMGAIHIAIKSCAKVCDSYQKRHAIVKYFTSPDWQDRFAEVAQTFRDLREDIQLDLQVHTSITVTEIKTNLSQLNCNLDKFMELVFRRMRSLEESELSTYVSSHGGINIIRKDENLLDETLARFAPADDKAKRVGGTQDNSGHTVAELRKEIKKGVDKILAEEEKFFDQKFEAWFKQVEEVKITVKRESDRVIDAVRAGPHERIVDRGWKGSVKARHLVMALRDHFVRGIHNNKLDKADEADVHIAKGMESASAQDQWAMRYITDLRLQLLQPLMEALDDDVSSFVTIDEVNAFTAARPLNWSLPRWIAYWTYGFEMTVQWYFRRIRKLFADIYFASKRALPANRQIIAEFMTSWEIRKIEDLLSALRDVDLWDDTNWDSDVRFLKFKDYVVGNETNMDKELRRVNYYIDEANTLAMVTGSGRPEKYLLPITFLLLQRGFSIISQGETKVLHEYELRLIQCSVQILMEEVLNRVRTLQVVYKWQNMNEKEQLSRFFYGLYAFTTEEPVMGSYWARDSLVDTNVFGEESHTYTESRNEESNPGCDTIPLVFGTQTEEIDRLILTASGQADSRDYNGIPRSLIGHWSGQYSYGGIREDDGLLSFTVSEQNIDRTFVGSGMDTYGPFTVEGYVEGNWVKFNKKYQLLQHGQEVAWRYEGVVTEDFDEVKGRWGYPADFNTPQIDSKDSGSEEDSEGNRDSEESRDAVGNGDTQETGEDSKIKSQFTFFLKHRPIEYLLSCPAQEEFIQNRPKALWKLALNASVRTVREKKLSWDVIAARRHQRQRYIEMAKTLEKFGRIHPDNTNEWHELLKTAHPNDIALWRTIMLFQIRREIGYYKTSEATSAIAAGVHCLQAAVFRVFPVRKMRFITPSTCVPAALFWESPS